jgi:hypothetical protein
MKLEGGRMYYECHITLERPAIAEDEPELKKDIESQFWSFSTILGDPIMGNKPFCFATKHIRADSVDKVITEMGVVARALILKGWNVVRQKIEIVVYDTRYRESR